MSLLRKLFNVVRGNVNEVGEAIADKNAITILEQQMRDVRTALGQSREQHANVLAQKKVSEQNVAQLRADIEKYENTAVRLSQTAPKEALEAANHVTTLEGRLAAEQQILDGYTASEAKISAAIKKCTTDLRSMEQQIDQVKANDSVIKAQTTASNALHTGHGNIKTAKDQLESIREKQRLQQAKLDAAGEIADEESGKSLDERLAAAEKPASAEDALSRILAKKSAQAGQ